MLLLLTGVLFLLKEKQFVSGLVQAALSPWALRALGSPPFSPASPVHTLPVTHA